MALDYESAVIQLVEHREDLQGKFRESVEGLDEMAHLGEEKIARIRRQLDAVEARLSQRSAELLAEWQQDRRRLRESLHALERDVFLAISGSTRSEACR